jgi:hypothetical protein
MTREELEDKLRTILEAHPKDFDCPKCTSQVNQIMALIDTYTATPHEEAELWTAEKVAQYTSRSDANSARVWLSRNGIKRVSDRPHPESGRPQALYRANEVRAAHLSKVLP